MAFAETTYTATAAQTDFTIPFPWIRDNHVKVEINDVAKTIGTDYTVGTPTSTELQLTVPASLNDRVRVFRETPKLDSGWLVSYTDPSSLRREDLDTDQRQIRYILQEIADDFAEGLKLDLADSKWDGQSRILKNLLDPVNVQDAVTKAYLDAQLISTGVVPTFGASESLYILRVNSAGTSVVWSPLLYETYLFEINGVGSTDSLGTAANFTGQNGGWYIPPNNVGYGTASEPGATGDQRAPLELIDSYVLSSGANVSVSGQEITVGAGQWIIEVEAHLRGLVRNSGTPTANGASASVALTATDGTVLDYGGGSLGDAESATVLLGGPWNDGSNQYMAGSGMAKIRYHANFASDTVINLRGRSLASAEVAVADIPSYVRITRWTR